MARVKWLRTVSDTIILSLYLEKGLELACACALKQLWVAVKDWEAGGRCQGEASRVSSRHGWGP